MKHEITMPVLSDTMQTGRLTRWNKSVGEAVKKGDALAEVETDKAILDVEAFQDGYLAGPLAPVEQDIPVRSVIAWLVDSREELGAAAENAASAKPAIAPSPASTAAASPVLPPPKHGRAGPSPCSPEGSAGRALQSSCCARWHPGKPLCTWPRPGIGGGAFQLRQRSHQQSRRTRRCPAWRRARAQRRTSISDRTLARHARCGGP